MDGHVSASSYRQMRVTIVCARDTCARGLIYNNICVDGTHIHAWIRPQDPAGGVPFDAERVALATCRHRDRDTRRSVCLSLRLLSVCVSHTRTDRDTHTAGDSKPGDVQDAAARVPVCICVHVHTEESVCILVHICCWCISTYRHAYCNIHYYLDFYRMHHARRQTGSVCWRLNVRPPLLSSGKSFAVDAYTDFRPWKFQTALPSDSHT